MSFHGDTGVGPAHVPDGLATCRASGRVRDAVHDRHREVRFTDGVARRASPSTKIEVDEGPAASDDLDLAAQRLEERGRSHGRPRDIILVLERGFRLELPLGILDPVLPTQKADRRTKCLAPRLRLWAIKLALHSPRNEIGSVPLLDARQQMTTWVWASLKHCVISAEILALGSCGSRAVRQALRPRDRRRAWPVQTLPHDGLADVAELHDRHTLVRLIHGVKAMRSGAGRCREAMRGTAGRSAVAVCASAAAARRTRAMAAANGTLNGGAVAWLNPACDPSSGN